MLRFLLMMSFIVFLLSCKKENNTPDQPVDEMLPPGMQIVKGTFTSTPGHNVQGTAKIFEDNGRKELRLENFTSTNGPDLRVYLSKDLNASSFISLGSLKSVKRKPELCNSRECLILRNISMYLSGVNNLPFYLVLQPLTDCLQGFIFIILHAPL